MDALKIRPPVGEFGRTFANVCTVYVLFFHDVFLAHQCLGRNLS